MDESCFISDSFDSLDDDFVVNEIVSRLQCAKSIFRLGMTSKRFNSLSSYPSLLEFSDFNYDDAGLIKYLNEFLDTRVVKKDNHVLGKNFKGLYMSLSNKKNVPKLLHFVRVNVNGWFHKVLCLDVEKLVLEWEGGPLPRKYHHQRLQLNLQDSMIPLKNLRLLKLTDMPISLNDSFGEWISTYCVNLEELDLSNIEVLSNTLRITSSSLKRFNFEGGFEEIHIASAPNLFSFRVFWTPVNHVREGFFPKIKISNTPNLNNLLLHAIPSFDSFTYDSSCDNDSKFSVLRTACVEYFEELTCIKRLLHDISLTRKLTILGHFLHEMSLESRTQYYANKFTKLEHLTAIMNADYVVEDEEYMWWDIADASVSFAKSIPNLKDVKLSTPKYPYDLHTPLGWLQNAMCLDVQKLEIEMDTDGEYMHEYKYHDVPKLNLQDSLVSLRNTKILTLHDIPVGLSHSFEHWISTCCSNLEELNLKGVLVVPTTFKIRSSSLKLFNIDAHFKDLYVSASKLVSLRVTWNLLYLGTKETKGTNVSLKVARYCPHLKEILLSNLQSSLPLEYYGCGKYYGYGDYDSKFPSLELATLLIPDTKKNISNDSMKRLLVDVSPARRLYVSNSILHKISCGNIMSVNPINKLEELQVCIVVKSNSKCQMKTHWKHAHETIVSFVKRVTTLKTLELTVKKDRYDPIVSKVFMESLGEIHLKSGFSRPMVFLDNPPNIMVEIQVCAGEDETLLLQRIIKKSPRGWKFLFKYKHN